MRSILSIRNGTRFLINSCFIVFIGILNKVIATFFLQRSTCNSTTTYCILNLASNCYFTLNSSAIFNRCRNIGNIQAIQT